MKLWGGRFTKETNELVNHFNASLPFDCRFYAQDIRGSIAHVTMLAKSGILTNDERDQIISGLTGILSDINNGTLTFDDGSEDIHSFVEAHLIERIGEAGKKLHTGRSRNDQVALDMRLYVKKEIVAIKKEILDFMEALCESAKNNLETVMPGYTHLQRAQPVTFGHYMMAYANMMRRDVIRLENCLEGMDDMPLGSGALASTTYPIDRDFVRQQLGFARVTNNSLDGVSDRDYCVELTAALSILMMHLSRFSEEIISWCSWEFKFVELDDAFSTGSSIMPQKKNPDVCELVRGKTGRVYGDLFTLLTMLKGIPLAYNKDMQEDKEAVFDAIDTVKQCLRVLTPMFSTMQILKDNMKKAALKGFINATDCADYLTKKGMPFRDAYRTVGQLVAQCVREDKSLADLTLEEYKEISPVFEEDIYEAISLKTCVEKRLTIGAPGAEAMKKVIMLEKKYLEEAENL